MQLYCFNGTIQNHHTELIFWSTDNPKRKTQCLSLKESRQSTAKPGLHPKKNASMLYLVEYSWNCSLWSAKCLDKLLMQTLIVNNWVEWTNLYAKSIRRLPTWQDRIVQGEHWKKLMNWDGRYYLTHHTSPISHPRISCIFLVAKNQLIFMDPGLKIYTLDGKRSLITTVITLLNLM